MSTHEDALGDLLWRELVDCGAMAARTPEQHMETYAVLLRFLQLARREGARIWSEHEASEERIREAFPIRRTITEPRVEQDPHVPDVRWRCNEGALLFKYAFMARWSSTFTGDITPDRLRFWTDLLANPETTREVEE